MTTTEKLLAELNRKRGVVYPQVGYSYFADIKGEYSDPTYRRCKVYTIVNEGGGVCYNHELNGPTPRKRCDAIRAAISKEA